MEHKLLNGASLAVSWPNEGLKICGGNISSNAFKVEGFAYISLDGSEIGYLFLSNQ